MNIKDPVTGLTMDELTYYGERGTRTLQTPFHINVSVEAINYTPVELEGIIPER